jgi:hypothetical protein
MAFSSKEPQLATISFPSGFLFKVAAASRLRSQYNKKNQQHKAIQQQQQGQLAAMSSSSDRSHKHQKQLQKQ